MGKACVGSMLCVWRAELEKECWRLVVWVVDDWEHLLLAAA